jgi:hypothetical protein
VNAMAFFKSITAKQIIVDKLETALTKYSD